jgi:hypothetical protein
VGRPRKQQEAGDEPISDEVVKVRFAKVWSSDRGYFGQGDQAELPANIAESLRTEGAVEVVDEE